MRTIKLQTTNNANKPGKPGKRKPGKTLWIERTLSSQSFILPINASTRSHNQDGVVSHIRPEQRDLLLLLIRNES
jgi:hypothetical protein